MESVMIYAKITELSNQYMIYNSVKNERKWEEKEMDCDNQELEATKKLREKKTDVIEEFKTHCKRHINFCNKIRKEEKREPDEFNQGREDMAKQFLNLLNGKEDWEITE